MRILGILVVLCSLIVLAEGMSAITAEGHLDSRVYMKMAPLIDPLVSLLPDAAQQEHTRKEVFQAAFSTTREVSMRLVEHGLLSLGLGVVQLGLGLGIILYPKSKHG
jgi:hypothetical protein